MAQVDGEIWEVGIDIRTFPVPRQQALDSERVSQPMQLRSAAVASGNAEASDEGSKGTAEGSVMKRPALLGNEERI
jgi:hypothetical protein